MFPKNFIYVSRNICFIEDGSDSKLDINTVINKAANDNLPEDQKKKEEPKKEENKKEEKKEKEKEEEDEPSEEEKEEFEKAKNLYRALKDPKAGPALLRIMAEQIGITGDSTKKDIEKVEKTVLSILTAKLGEEYSGFAAKLAPAIEEAMDFVAEKKTSGIRQSLENRNKVELDHTILNGLDSAFGEYDKLDEKSETTLLKSVNKLMDEIIPGKGVSPDAYFKRLLKLAAEENGISLKKKGTSTTRTIDTERALKNSQDASSRIASKEGSQKDGIASKDKSEKVSIQTAIDRAVEKVNASMQKT